MLWLWLDSFLCDRVLKAGQIGHPETGSRGSAVSFFSPHQLRTILGKGFPTERKLQWEYEGSP